MPSASLLDAIHALCHEGRGLSEEEARGAMQSILAGGETPVQIAAFLVALRMKGETIDEVTGFARAMREAAVPVHGADGDEPLLDTCGTGGDGIGSFNISTVTAFVTAGAGVRVAKHGNRSISSRSSSAAVLEALGVQMAATAAEAEACLRETGMCFLYAPAFHASTRHVQPVRAELKLRTVFHLLGPLTNPAGANAQLAGAFSVRAAELMAGALARMGLRHGFVVHGADGLDEVTTTTTTTVFAIENGKVTEEVLSPASFGVSAASRNDLAGGDPTENAAIARAVLGGDRGPQRDVVLANTALALLAAGRAESLTDAMTQAAYSIDSGAAAGKLAAVVAFTEAATLAKI